MATAVEGKTDIGIASDDIDTPLTCKPCEEDGEHLKAFGLCVNCGEYLCRKCYEVHLIPSITRKHVLKRLEKEQKSETTHGSKYSCQLHSDENIKYHCPTHSFFGCHVCSFRHQKSCKDVIYIPDVTMPTSGSGECGQLFSKLENLTDTSKHVLMREWVKSSLQTIISRHTEAITSIKEFKQELINLIDKLEKELLEKMDKQQIDETKRMEELAIKCEKILIDAQKMSAPMEVLQTTNRDCDLYIEIVQSKDKIHNLADQLKLIEKNKPVSMPVFQPNKDFTDLLISPRSLGSLTLKSIIIENLEHVQNINCKSRNDTGDYLVAGSVLLPGYKLIVTDCGSKNTVKMINTQDNKIQSDLKLSPWAWGICKVTDTSVAVTLPGDTKVTLLRTSPTLATERKIVLNERPYGIDHLDGKLVVSYKYRI